MRLVLHVGMDKTGTTTLQQTFRRHRSELLEAGILYPDSSSDRWRHHQLLMCSASPPDRLSREFAELRELPPEEVSEVGRSWLQDVIRQVDASDAHTVILSYEGLWELDGGYVARLARALSPTFSTIDVVAYLRHPASHWVARAQQSVKLSWAITRPRAHLIRYRERLSNYLDAFGSVTPVAFDPLILMEGCVVRDFLTRHVPSGADVYQRIEVQNSNDSMSAEAMCIMQALWRHGTHGEGNTREASALAVRQVLEKMDQVDPQTKPSIEPGLAAALARNHDDDLRWLAERFALEFPSFDVDPTTPLSDPDLGESRDLRVLLQVDGEQLERTTYRLMEELAARQRRPRRGGLRPTSPADPTASPDAQVARSVELAQEVRSLVTRGRWGQLMTRVRRKLRSLSPG